ncbi:hypothetical protein VOLCADRAFT_95969 [Volvox carteri f. nagariensis]|uniref:Uncharacterized protein n=1 Tax=Volvox carteri f. nagariensis TaxID=3068 RepID=D8U8V3_VOLCA|nr:uncharacterized protein VOLCADRAFT_95969 [Volvox carteri f. nagariensis]EFJ43871.1 hypothetical protein VOLCADRAFT_95969 [Volvox carteri f. nagariensis]|eukprot:XP_002955117.1 hypothetical protein VOLCADRAFT_95969 [Volvox carteri f. nagariensis]
MNEHPKVGTEGDDVPDRFQLTGDQGRPPAPYEGEGTHRYETRMTDEEIAHGLGRDARRASQVLHHQLSGGGMGQGQTEGTSDSFRADLVPRPSEEEAMQKALGSPQPSPHASQQL